MKIKTFISNKFFSANMYICQVEKGNFIVDPGFFDERVKNYIDSIGGIKFILLTHGHFDHIGGINDLLESYPNIPIYSFNDEIEVITNPRKSCAIMASDRGKEFKKYVPDCFINGLYEGRNEIEGIPFNLIHTPGHTIGGAMYYFQDDKVIFTGDTIIAESIGRADLPTASEKELYKSLNKFKSLNLPNDTTCYFGHGLAMSIDTLIKKNIYLR